MNRDQIEELAALDALGALDGDDVAAWEAAGKENPALLRARDEFADVAARLSLLAAEVPAPAALRSRVMDAVFGAEAKRANETERNESSFGWAAWAAAAAGEAAGITAAAYSLRQGPPTTLSATTETTTQRA